MTSRRKPSKTMRIFSSGVYLRRVAALTWRTNERVSSLRRSATLALSVSGWGHFCSFPEVLYPHYRSSHHSKTLGFSTSHMCPIIADVLHSGLQTRYVRRLSTRYSIASSGRDSTPCRVEGLFTMSSGSGRGGRRRFENGISPSDGISWKGRASRGRLLNGSSSVLIPMRTTKPS